VSDLFKNDKYRLFGFHRHTRHLSKSVLNFLATGEYKVVDKKLKEKCNALEYFKKQQNTASLEKQPELELDLYLSHNM